MEENFIIYGKKDNVLNFVQFLEKIEIDSFLLGFCENKEMIKNTQFHNKPIFDYQDAINQNAPFLILENNYDKEIEITDLLLNESSKIILRYDLIDFFGKADIKFQAGLIFNYPEFLKKNYYKDYLVLRDKLNMKIIDKPNLNTFDIENGKLKEYIINSLDYDQLYNDFYEDLIKLPKYVGTGQYSDIIWWCWLQGEENAPDICRACLASVRKNFPDKKIVVITLENMYDYIDLPDYVKLKHKMGVINNTNFSDIVRLELLIKYGGTWIDSTVLVSGNADYIFNHPLFIFSWDWLDETRTVGTWLISAEKSNPLLKYTLDLFYWYWEKYDHLINYFLLHILFSMVSKTYSEEYSRFATISTAGKHILQTKIFKEYSIEEFNEITKISDIHKLTYKIDLPYSIENTNYKHILDIYNITPFKELKNGIIQISQIDSEFSIYENSIVFLYGKNIINEELIQLFEYHNINIHYICDVSKENWGEVYNGISIISPIYFEYILKNNSHKLMMKKDIVIQFASKNISSDTIKKISSMGISKIISFDEAYQVLKSTSSYDLLKVNPQISEQENYSSVREVWSGTVSCHKYINENYLKQQINIICTMQKTGDHTLIKTLKNVNLSYYVIWHSPEQLDVKLFKSLDKKVKIITGVRDPISQNLSVIYQKLSGASLLHQNLLLRSLKGDALFKDGGNVQELWDLMYAEPENSNPISNIMKRFKTAGLDLSKQQFDKEKGRTVIVDENVEVFIYQLEKLNSLANEMSDWLGQTPFDKWEIANVADDKWIADSYNQAKKSIKITQEHFDLCYNDPWIKHFYSQEDIEKFKERWRPHIRK